MSYFNKYHMDMLIWDDGKLNFLIDKYGNKSDAMAEIVKKLITADKNLSMGCKEDILDKDSLMPNKEVLDRWSNQVHKEYEDCIELIRRQLEIDPANPDIHALIGYSKFRQDRYRDAVENLFQAVKLSSYSVPFLEELMLVLELLIYHEKENKFYHK